MSMIDFSMALFNISADAMITQKNNMQTAFTFAPVESPQEYFVPHSGVLVGLESIREAVRSEQVLCAGQLVLVQGPKGVGKSHLVQIGVAEARSLKLPTSTFTLDQMGFWRSSNEPVSVETFIDAYQKVKTTGGLVFVETTPAYQAMASNPHVLSRLNSGLIVDLSYPDDSELKSILVSLLERYYLRLPDKQLEKILLEVPGIPEYFQSVSKALQALLAQGNRFKPKVLKQVLSGECT